MIIKEMNFKDNSYTIGFKEFRSSSGTLLECRILKKILFFHIIIYKKVSLKTLSPNYKDIALYTIIDYERELKQQEELVDAEW